MDITFGSGLQIPTRVRSKGGTPPDGICNPVRSVLCNGKTLVCGHNVRVGLQIPTRVRSKGGTMEGFRRMLWVGRQHSADHIPVSALHSAGRDL